MKTALWLLLIGSMLLGFHAWANASGSQLAQVRERPPVREGPLDIAGPDRGEEAPVPTPRAGSRPSVSREPTLADLAAQLDTVNRRLDALESELESLKASLGHTTEKQPSATRRVIGRSAPFWMPVEQAQAEVQNSQRK